MNSTSYLTCIKDNQNKFNCQVQDKAKKYPYETGFLCVLVGYYLS